MISAWARPVINGGGTVTRTATATPTATTTAVAPRQIIQAGSAWQGPKYAPIQQVPLKRSIVSETGPVTFPSDITFTRLPDMPSGSIYTNQQIRDMLERGEMNERGEKESGAEFELEQQAVDAGATSAFNRDASGTPVPADTTSDTKGIGWLLAAIAGFYFLS